MTWIRARCDSSACAEVWIGPNCDTGSCPEVRIGLTDVAIRNSQRPDQIVVFDLREWAAFVADAKSGRFDVGE